MNGEMNLKKSVLQEMDLGQMPEPQEGAIPIAFVRLTVKKDHTTNVEVAFVERGEDGMTPLEVKLEMLHLLRSGVEDTERRLMRGEIK